MSSGRHIASKISLKSPIQVGIGGISGCLVVVVAVITVLALAGFATRQMPRWCSRALRGRRLSASASFTISGSQLTILLTNTDAATGAGISRPCPSAVLSGLFFNLGTSTFTPCFGEHRIGDGVDHPGTVSNGRNATLRAAPGRPTSAASGATRSGGAAGLAGTTQGISSARLPERQHELGQLQRPELPEPECARTASSSAWCPTAGWLAAATAAWTVMR